MSSTAGANFSNSATTSGVPLRDPTINYIVLGFAFLLEGTSWSIAVREFNAGRGGQGWWKAVKRSKDPAGFIVLFEDSAALAGLAIAATGVWISHATGDARYDGMASIAIGGVLAAPFGAIIAKRVPTRTLLAMVGDVLTLTSVYSLYRAIV